jgi:phosphotriesterase-related protein
MIAVNTAAGPVDAANLGRTLMHEHVFIVTPEIRDEYGDWDEDEQVNSAVQKLRELRDRGIDTLVDLTAIGLGRYVPRIARVAKESGMQIVVASGIYTLFEFPRYFSRKLAFEGENYVEEFFVNEIQNGIGISGVKPGVLKCATGHKGLTRDVEAILRMTARAHRRTGVPISTHTDAMTKQGLAQQKVFREEGVDLSRVVIGHSGDTTDLEYLEELLTQGSYLGMDRFGLDLLCSFEDRVNTVAELCKRGHVERLVLSHDAGCTFDYLPDDIHQRKGYTNWHYNHIVDDVLPALLQAGVSEAEITCMLVENPRRIFETSTPY